MKVEHKRLKDECCTLKFNEIDAEESAQVISDGGATRSCFVLTKPGVPITFQCTTHLPENTEEFIEVVVDGVSRSMATVRKGQGKKHFYKTKFDKVLSYRFEGGKKKGLKICDNIKTTPGAPASAVSTIEVQHWRKYPENSETAASGVQSAKERAPKYDQVPRWSDREQTFSDDIPHEYSIQFTGDGKSSKTLKDRIAEDKDDFKHFRTYKFRYINVCYLDLVSPDQFQKLGGATPSAKQSSPQVVVPVKDKSQEKQSKETAENDRKVSKFVKSNEKESGESSKTTLEKSEKSKAEESPSAQTGENKTPSEPTTNGKPESLDAVKAARKVSETTSSSKPATEGKPGERATTIDLRSQSPDFGGWPSDDEDAELVPDQVLSPSPLPEKDEEIEENAVGHTELPAEKQFTVLEEGQDVLEDYHATVEELIQEDQEAANSFKPIALEDMDIDAEMEEGEVAPVPALVSKKRSVVYGFPGGPADKCRARDDAMRSSADPMEGVQSTRSSTPVDEDKGDKGAESTDAKNSLMTPPPSTQKLVESIEVPVSSTPLNNLQSPTRALSPLRNVHPISEEDGASAVTAIRNPARRFSFENGMNLIQRVEEGAREGNIGNLNSLDLNVPESRFARIPRTSGNRRPAGKGMSASPAPENIPAHIRQQSSKESLQALFHLESVPVPRTEKVVLVEDEYVIPKLSKQDALSAKPVPNRENGVVPRIDSPKDNNIDVEKLIGAIDPSKQKDAPTKKPIGEKAGISRPLLSEAGVLFEKNDHVVPKTQDSFLRAHKKRQEQERLSVSTQLVPVRTPSPTALTPTIPPRPQKVTAPRPSTPPTPSPAPRSRPSDFSVKQSIEKPSKHAKQPSAVTNPVEQLSNPSSSKPTPAIAQPKPSKPNGVAQGVSTSATNTSTSKNKKRKANGEGINGIDGRAAKKVATSTSTSTAANKAETDLNQAKRAALARLEKAKKVREDLDKKEALLEEIKGIEEEAARIEGENEVKKENMEKFGDMSV
ncbi:hypothetical protein HYALB_00004971 [Hymenoscyphus albidus]|uniref:Uncharacterized protein n=1 Tax=Hymenoscyphus albidus TaxID=595503 RepID=A0A9N9LQM2_9HELO|nr:hypothetical protein HYALB_00004971 [Hymenoscyphus albidus]